MSNLTISVNEIFSIRQFRLETDVQRLLDLRVAIETVDRVGTNTSVQALQAEFNWNGHDPEKDRWVVELTESPNTFLGHAWIFHQTTERSILHVAIHPIYRRQKIGNKLLEKAVDRGREMGAIQIVAGAEKEDEIGDVFLRTQGFQPIGQNRHMIALANSKIDLPKWPTGFQIRSYAELKDLSYVVEACNVCYADMWGHSENSVPSTVDGYSEIMQKYPDYFLPEGMFVLFFSDEVAGICFGRIEQTDNDAPRKVIDSPAVIPAFRHLKLQRQLVWTAMSWLNSIAAGDFHLYSWGDTDKTVSIYQDIGFAYHSHTIEYLLLEIDGLRP